MISETEVETCRTRARAILAGMDQVLLGQEAMTRLTLTGMLAGGHVLLEGLPGLGKTELVKALGSLCGCDYKRIQFTPDLLPGDITGTHVLQQTPDGGREQVFRPGPVFAQIVLADEINRASPKTQSALLEAMQEHSVTVLETTHRLPEPFFVLATQNPIELDGTYPLPEAQLDRFAMKVTVAGVERSVLAQIVLQRQSGVAPVPEPVTDAAGLAELLAAVRRVALPEAVGRYLAHLVDATRPDRETSPECVRRYVRWGASPRAALTLAACARAAALLAGRPAVGFEDVRAVAVPTLAHRLVLGYEAGLEDLDAAAVVRTLIAETPELAV
ncbi:MAG: AAA family ATPase [Planctomycetota bacterium]